MDQNKANIKKLKSEDENNQFTVSRRKNLINEIKNKVFNILKGKYFKYIELDPVIESNNLYFNVQAKISKNIYSLFIIQMDRNFL